MSSAGIARSAAHPGCVWHAIFHLQLSVGEKILRTILIYALLVALLRIVGKRELGQSNTLDLVVLLLVANAVQNGIIGNDLSVTGATIGAVTLFAVNEGLSRASYALPWVSRVLEGDPTVLIADSKPVKRALRRAGISLSELRAIARRQGFDDLGEVHAAILETNGDRDDVHEGRAEALPPGRARHPHGQAARRPMLRLPRTWRPCQLTGATPTHPSPLASSSRCDVRTGTA